MEKENERIMVMRMLMTVRIERVFCSNVNYEMKVRGSKIRDVLSDIVFDNI